MPRKAKEAKPPRDTTFTPLSEEWSDENEGSGGLESDVSTRLSDRQSGTPRRRRKATQVRTPTRKTGKKETSQRHREVYPQQQNGSLISEVAYDGLGLVRFGLKLFKDLYPLWKWVVFGYVLWMGISYAILSVYTSAMTALGPVCSIPFIGSKIPLCNGAFGPTDRPIDASRIATSQDGLTVVADRVGQNFDLAKDMVGHEFAVRDLRIRVAASNLSRKKELARELESLVRYTKQTARGLSRFTVKVSKSIDTVRTFDEYAVKALEAIADRQRNPPSLPARIVSAISPFAVFSLAAPDQPEEQVKELFIATASRISDKVRILLDETFELALGLDAVQEVLERIKELSIDELGDLPQMDVLGGLWTRLTRPDDFGEYDSHMKLLRDMTNFYESASQVVRETSAALNRVEAELSEFRDDFATPGLILKDHPIEVIIALLRTSGQRLEAGKQEIQFLDR